MSTKRRGTETTEDRFTAVPHHVLEALYQTRLPESALRVAMYVLRQTVGFNRETTLNYASAARTAAKTGLSVGAVKKAYGRLIGARVLRQARKGGPGKGASVYAWNPPAKWTCRSRKAEGLFESPSSETDTTLAGPGVHPDPMGSTHPDPMGSTHPDTLRDQDQRFHLERQQQQADGASGSSFEEKASSTHHERKWTATKLYKHLGGRKLAPVDHEWLSQVVSTNPDETLDAALTASQGANSPPKLFRSLFDSADGWKRRPTIQDEPERRRFVVPDKWGRGLPGGGRWTRLIRAWPEDARKEYVARCEGGEPKGEVFVDLNDRHPERVIVPRVIVPRNYTLGLPGGAKDQREIRDEWGDEERKEYVDRIKAGELKGEVLVDVSDRFREKERASAPERRPTIQDEPERRPFVVPDEYARGLAGGGLWTRLIRAWPEATQREYVKRLNEGEELTDVWLEMHERHPEERPRA
jgi:hypothetical protein